MKEHKAEKRKRRVQRRVQEEGRAQTFVIVMTQTYTHTDAHSHHT